MKEVLFFVPLIGARKAEGKGGLLQPAEEVGERSEQVFQVTQAPAVCQSINVPPETWD